MINKYILFLKNIYIIFIINYKIKKIKLNKINKDFIEIISNKKIKVTIN